MVEVETNSDIGMYIFSLS